MSPLGWVLCLSNMPLVATFIMTAGIELGRNILTIELMFS